eukprot:NODE_3804_length_632_cov_50.041166_g2738_i0.p5 GENE.NODE_3804_length_632_cov_50.041166_g2738_i0~~NODE_3804_length_632_cov_50.041166_g2738_i0.p5  ORF type:complete len:55 (+),score=10.88 NODE_3804_length_632_cov_50.041166_g2738_i0:237-401(+)
MKKNIPIKAEQTGKKSTNHITLGHTATNFPPPQKKTNGTSTTTSAPPPSTPTTI